MLPEASATLRRNLQVNQVNAALQAVVANMLAPFIALLALRLGASNVQLGAFNSLPNLLTFLFTLPMVARIERRRQQGATLRRAFLISRLLLLALAAVPLVGPRWSVWLLVGVWGLHTYPFNVANSLLPGYLADLLPPTDVGPALAARGSLSTITGTITILALGLLLDRLPFPSGYQWVAVAACLVGLVEVYTFSLFVEERRSPGAPRAAHSWWHDLADSARLLRNQRGFATYVAASMFFHFSWQAVWPAFSRFQVEVLHADNLWLALVQVGGAIGAYFSYRVWTRRAEQVGTARMWSLAALLLATAPVGTLLCPSMAWVSLLQIIVGAGVAGATVLPQFGVLRYAPSHERPLYLGLHQTAIMAAACVAPVLGGWAIDLLGVDLTLLLGTGLRLASALLLWWLGRREAEPQSQAA